MLASRSRVLTPRSFRWLLTLLCLLGVARPGWADDPRGSARAHYARGLELASQNGYEAALREFNEAYAISPQFAVLYNIGQAHVALGHSLEAIEVLSRYLRDGQDRLPPGRREQVQAQIAHLRADLASALPASSPEAEEARAAAAASARAAAGVADAATEIGARPLTRTGTLSVRCAEPGLKILLDGQNVDPTSATRGLPVAAGPHRLALTAQGRRAPEQSLDVPAGATAIVVCQNLPPAPAEHPRVSIDGPPVFSNVLTHDGPPVFSNVISGPPASPSVVEHPKPPGVRASTVGYALGGVGVVLGGAAVGVYLWNRGQYDKAQTALKPRTPEQLTADDDIYDPVGRLQRARRSDPPRELRDRGPGRGQRGLPRGRHLPLAPRSDGAATSRRRWSPGGAGERSRRAASRGTACGSGAGDDHVARSGVAPVGAGPASVLRHPEGGSGRLRDRRLRGRGPDPEIQPVRASGAATRSRAPSEPTVARTAVLTAPTVASPSHATRSGTWRQQQPVRARRPTFQLQDPPDVRCEVIDVRDARHRSTSPAFGAIAFQAMFTVRHPELGHMLRVELGCAAMDLGPLRHQLTAPRSTVTGRANRSRSNRSGRPATRACLQQIDSIRFTVRPGLAEWAIDERDAPYRRRHPGEVGHVRTSARTSAGRPRTRESRGTGIQVPRARALVAGPAVARPSAGCKRSSCPSSSRFSFSRCRCSRRTTPRPPPPAAPAEAAPAPRRAGGEEEGRRTVAGAVARDAAGRRPTDVARRAGAGGRARSRARSGSST